MNAIKILLVGFVTTRGLRCILLKLNFNWSDKYCDADMVASRSQIYNVQIATSVSFSEKKKRTD